VFTTLVSAAQLAEQFPGWAVFDCRFDLKDPHAGLAAYRSAHIPGSAYVSLDTDLSAPPSGTTGRHPLPSVEAMTETFSALGIGPDTQVVTYDADNGMYASRLWWMLRYLGHDAVAVLDGGLAAWTKEGRPTRSGDEHRQRAQFVPHVRREWLATIDDVTNTSSRKPLLVDARAPERFEGRNETIDRAAGHIPGAVNRFFKDNLTEAGTMRPPEELRQAWNAVLGGRAPNDVVMYCGSGVTACQNLLALEHTGISGTRLFVGSWSEWSADPARPIETGPATPLT
jgi:thiosulfate/3-mercaptopyruvate sulfurtransferase